MIKKHLAYFVLILFIASDANATTLTQPEQLVLLPVEKMSSWGKPKTLPPGAHDYLLSGNPGKPGLYTFRFELPSHYKIPPFSLSSTSYITVISGKLYVGEGRKFVKNNQHILPAGSYIVAPAYKPLYFWTEEKTILQFHGVGPIDVNYINLSDDPRRIKNRIS
jgi:hypothetical protein